MTDAFNGGVFEVILELIEKFPEHNHVILYRSHSWDPVSENHKFSRPNVEMIEWPKNTIQKFMHLKKIVRAHKPNYVHLHSSMAGFIGRLIPGSKEITLYSPHAFAFQKLDVPRLVRKILFVLEVLLQKRTHINVAFWPIEKILFESLPGSREIIYAPIMIEKFLEKPLPESFGVDEIYNAETLTVLSIGRLAPQKDPDFFIQVVKNLRKEKLINFEWYGDGTKFPASSMTDAGIILKGWVEPSQIFGDISKKRSIAVFTSRWESGPITLFECLASGIPVVCRSENVFIGYGFKDGETPEKLVDRILEINSNRDLRVVAVEQREALIKKLPTSETLSLLDLYLAKARL